MDSIHKAISEVIEKCDVCLAGNVISKELLIRTFSDFISTTIENKKHNIGIVLHTGSICFDAVLLAYAAISDVMYNQTYADDVIASLVPGDLVLYYSGSKEHAQAQRYTFMGFVNNPGDKPSVSEAAYILLEQGESNKTYVPHQGRSRIIPYLGNSTSMDGRGIRRESGKRRQFFSYVLDMHDTDIPRTIDTSTVIVISRDEANRLVNDLSFKFNGTDVKLTELVPVSYFTESNQEYQYGANPSKNEPVIKLTGKVSVARKLLLKKGGNRHVGLIVLGEESYRRGESELPELLERQSIQYVYLSMHLDSEMSAKLIAKYDDADLFACTKDFLLSNSRPPIIKNSFTEQMDPQISAIIDKEVSATIISGFIDWDKYKAFKKAMFFIKTSEYDSDEKDDFIVQAHSLMNLFLTSVFPICFLEELIDVGVVDNVEKPELRLQLLEEAKNTFPEFLKENASFAVGILEDAYFELNDSTPKESSFSEIIKDNLQKKIAVVVPKAYYAVVIERMLRAKGVEDLTGFHVVTANRFDNARLYDLIIVVGNISGKRFDALRCRSSQIINVLLYEAEKYQYKKQVRGAKAAEHLLNKRSTIFTDDEYVEEALEIDEDEIQEVAVIDSEISDYVSSTVIKAVRNCICSDDTKNMANIVAVAKFDSDEVAFFTKNYKAYILDEAESSVKEVAVSDLTEGAVIVFTRSTSRTRDIVEEILRDMIKNRLVSEEVERAYYKSREWKTTLIDYMKRTGSSAKVIADEMIANGVSVQEITIRGWLDEESHTVRPQRLDSIQQIALIAGNDELFDSAEECFAAGGQIYRIRRQILETIGQAILGEVTGKVDASDSMSEAIAERIKDAAVTLQIESITFLDDEVPINTINRPLTID